MRNSDWGQGLFCWMCWFALACLLAGATEHAQAGLSFAAAPIYRAGIGPRSVATGDFNGDGKLDLAVANEGSNNVSILLGNGDGIFAPAVNYDTGSGLRFVAVGDVNGDGKLDLVVTNLGGVAILLGHGDGTFAAAIGYGAGGPGGSVVLGDFNGDGKVDLAATYGNPYGAGGVSILLGNGNGTFAPAVNYAAGGVAGSLVVNDFNGDGKADLAVTNGSSVFILLGSGDGTFASSANYVGLAGVAIAAGDFNGDGKVDLAMASVGGVSILLGNGDGTFVPVVNYAAAGSSVVVGDFNGDGKLDLALAGISAKNYDNSSYRVSVLLGNGDGTFAPAVNYYSGRNPLSAVLGDFNGDSKLDIAVANGNGISILMNNGDGTFAGAVIYDAVDDTGSHSVAVRVADFSGDGKADLAVTSGSGVSILLGKGSGTFATEVKYAVPGGAGAIAIEDLNGDGKADLAVTNGNGVSILLGNGDGTFAPAISYAAPGSSVVVGDFNGDGKLDLAVANVYSNNVSILLGNGDGTFAPAVNFGGISGVISVIAVGDFNGDAKLDLAAAHSNGIAILRGNGDGTFGGAVNYAAGGSAYSLVVSDFNSDGKADLAVTNYSNIFGSSVSILLGNGDGTFAPAVNSVAPGSSLVVGDFNGDGKADLAVTKGDGASILLGKGDGTFAVPVDYVAGTSPQTVVVGDFNGDGKLDLAVGYYYSYAYVCCSLIARVGDGAFFELANADIGGSSVAEVGWNGVSQPHTTVTYWVGNKVSVLLNTSASSNANLSNLTLSSGTLNPSFASGTTSYTAPVTNGAISVTVTPTVTDSTATVKVNGMLVPSGSASAGITLNTSGTTTITVLVTAQDGTTKTYTVAVSVPPSRLINLSTRGPVQTVDNVMIGGFIIGGSTPKTVLITARGPSLSAYGVSGVLANPILNLYSGQTVIATNDNWGDAPNVAAIQATGVAPGDALESAILTTLIPGPYTAIMSGANGTTGVGIVEVFEVDNANSPLINISTRGRVLTGDNVLIGGFIIQGNSPQTVLIRAVGPNLANYGVPGVLSDPVLQLFSGQTMIASNDNWMDAANAAAIQTTGTAPAYPKESAILITLDPGPYTAIMSGANGATGVGIVEVIAQ